ncbi:MAG: hypothetical protein AAFY99_02040 [Pseudomonadota bacterium]
MYDDTTKPSWGVTFWALAGFALLIAIVLLVGGDNGDIAGQSVTTLS